MGTITVETAERLALVDITAQVEEAIPDGTTGVVTIFSTHTTAGVTINEAESRLVGDMETFLEELVPDSGWEHDRLDGNADSHLRAMLIGPSESIPVEDGTLQLGTWQSVLLVECDGPRTRTIHVATE